MIPYYHSHWKVYGCAFTRCTFHLVFFRCLHSLFTYSLSNAFSFFNIDMSVCPVLFSFSLNNIFYHFLQGSSSGNKFLYFSLSEKVIISPLFLKGNFTGCTNLDWQNLFSQHFNYFTTLSVCLHGFWGEIKVILIFAHL